MRKFCLALLGALAAFAARADDLAKLQEDPKQWVTPGGNYANWRYSPLRQITPENVGRLQTAWSFSTGVLGGHEGAPLVVGDVMYLVTPFPNTVYALDLSNEGRIIWKWVSKQDPAVAKVMCCDKVNRGLAYADGRVFLSQADTKLVAFDAKNGRVLWESANGDPAKGETSTGAPYVFKGKLLIGSSGGEFGVRGHITAYDAKTGHRIWRGYSTGPAAETLIDPEKTTQLRKPVGKEASLASWEIEQWTVGGGTVWGRLSHDPEFNLVYYGTGNPAPGNARQRPGDNKWTSTIFARDLDTGAVKWVYQATPHDEWDYDAIGEMILVDQNIDGVMRKTLVHFDKNGFAYVLDRSTGELLSADKFDASVNWASKIDLDKGSPTYGRPRVVERYSPDKNGEDVNTRDICPSSWGAKKSGAGGLFSSRGCLLHSGGSRVHGSRAISNAICRRPPLQGHDGRDSPLLSERSTVSRGA
jgi:alcohol dehydrogenase (cytochrome c)